MLALGESVELPLPEVAVIDYELKMS